MTLKLSLGYLVLCNGDVWKLEIWEKLEILAKLEVWIDETSNIIVS